MEELQRKIIALTSDKEARFFYHFTSVSGEKILEEGLIVANPRWEQSFLEFTEEEINNIAGVLEDNKSTQLKNNNYMIIAGVYKDAMQYFIRKISPEESIDIDWYGVDTPDYIVDNNYLMGYIDLESLELVVNDYATVYSEDMNL